MSLHDDEDNKRQRSVKLCQLICDRQIDSEIGIEIRKLLEQGVLINFQDHKRNKKTAIHLAVDKGDITCVSFLLQFKPNLEVKDEGGKSPVELAESNGDQRILSVLLNSTVDVVNKSYIEVIDYESLTRQRIESIKSRPTFKVLKLTDCPSVNKVWMKLIDHNYMQALNASSHLFFIAIETNEMNIRNNHELMMKALNLRRPMIVQLCSLNSQDIKIYFKDETKDFVEITDTPLMTLKEFNEAIQSYDECHFNLLVAALRSKLFGPFTGDLLDTKLNTSEARSEAVNQFAKSNALCHRFLKLFDEGLPSIDRIVATLSFKGDQSLSVLLDLPFEPKDGKLKLNEYQQDILSVVDSSGCNLLIMAVEQTNLDAVKLLLRCGCDFNYYDSYKYRASDTCWEKKAIECLAALIDAGSPYPCYFSICELDEPSGAHERINKMIEAINSFHEHIKQGETEEVEAFIASHPHIKHAFNINNVCALTVALQSGRVEIHSLLLSEGFEPGADDEYYDALDKFEKKFKIRNSNQKYFKEAFDEPHLKRLVDKSKVSFGSKDRAKCSTIIRKMFDELNEIDELIPILQICSLSDKLRIVFDFNCDFVVDMTPTSPSNAPAALYPVSGFIYVAVKNHEKDFYQVIGYLIHELMHYAMILTYDNDCKPYDDDDFESANPFETITKGTKKICDENPSTDSIVATVFSLYKKELWDTELIVRVPHLLAQYNTNPKALEAAERNTPELFHFYRETTLKDVKRQSEVWLQKYSIGKINNQTGISRKIENLNVEFENVEIDLKPTVNIITSNAPQLTLAMLRQSDCDDSHIFVSLEQVAIGNILNKIAKVNSTVLIVDCIGLAQKYQESLRKLVKTMKNIKAIAFVMTEAESSKAKENFSKVEFKTLTHKWGELTESSKVHLLNQNVIFQGVAMKLNELVKPTSEAMNFFPLGSIVDCKDFQIGHELHQTSHNFYIPRKFIKKGQGSAKSFADLLRDESMTGAMIISDEAGSGKSVALFEIAKSLHAAFPGRWVLIVDLKRHIAAFKGAEDYEIIESFEDFIAQNILKNEPELDRQLFKQMFRVGKTAVLFDGFDEICPNYKDLFLHVLKLPRSGNQLYITTRPHLEADLKGVLGQFVFKLEEFSEESQTRFLKEYWRSVGFEMSHEDFEVLSQRLLEKFSEIANSNIVGLPLLMRMTAEIFDDPKQENLLQKVDSLSISSVFREFVEKHLKRWKEKGNENEISRNENVEIDMAGGVLGVHHSIAINLKFDGFLVFDVDEVDAEKISRVGLIRYDKTEKTFQFVHQTFAEYFVADFICFYLNRKSRDPSYECSKAIEVTCEVLYSMGYMNVVQTFLDQILEAMKFIPSEALCKSVAKWLSDVLKRRNYFDLLSNSLNRSPENVASLALSIVKHVEKDVLLKVLQSEPGSGRSVLLDAAAHGSNAIFSALCDIITTRTDNSKEIYQFEGDFYGNVLLQAARNRHTGVLTTLCENLNYVLMKEEIKTKFEKIDGGNSIIHIATDNRNDEVFLELLSLLPNYLSHDEIKSLLLAVDNDNHNFFHRAIKDDTSESLKLKFEVVKSNFDIEEQKIFFFRPPTSRNMFSYAAENRDGKIFETLIESTRGVLSDEEIKSMMLEKDSRGSNVLHIIALHGNVSSLNELNLLLRERLSDDEIRSLLLEVNSWGANCFRYAANNTELNLQVFYETIGNLLPIEDQTRLLQQSSNNIDIIRLACGTYTNEIVPNETIKHLMTEQVYGQNVFQHVATYNDDDTWKKMISFAQARFSVDEVKSFLFRFDYSGHNCLHLAVSSDSNTNMIEAICDTIKTVSSVDDQKRFAQQRDRDKRNVFHRAAQFNKTFSLYESLSSILSKDEVREMVKEKDSGGNNILCSHTMYNLPNAALHDLMSFLQEILTYDEIKDLLFDVDREGRNLFHRTVQHSTKTEIKSSIKAIKEVLSQDDQKKFFGAKVPNVFHLVAENQNKIFFSIVNELLKNLLTENEMKVLMIEKNSDNQNVLHLLCHLDDSAASFMNEKRLGDFLKVLKVVFDADELENFLTSSDNHGSNCLLLAAQFKDQPFLNELFSFIRSELSIDEQRNFIQKCDNEGNNIFKCAFLNEITEVPSFVEQFAKELLSESQIKEMTKKKKKSKCACM